MGGQGSGCRARFIKGVLQILTDEGHWVNIRAGKASHHCTSFVWRYKHTRVAHHNSNHLYLAFAQSAPYLLLPSPPPPPLIPCPPSPALRDAAALGPRADGHLDADPQPHRGLPGGGTEQERGRQGLRTTQRQPRTTAVRATGRRLRG